MICPPKLSICIATYSRAGFILETLNSIACQLTSAVELIVVDGASPDDTSSVLSKFLIEHPSVQYYRESENGGVDRDYDKAVGYARGEYCWLMTDDDLIVPGAIDRVLSSLHEDFELIVVNSEMRNADFSKTLRQRFLAVQADKQYGPNDGDAFFSEVAPYLSFIGAVVIKRSLWAVRDRERYFGTLFIHVGVIFQTPQISRALVLADPLIVIRYGNAMWSARAFEIWMLKWPSLIWSFSDQSDQAKSIVSPREPWRRWRKLGVYRAIGAYSLAEYRKFLRPKLSGISRLAPFLIAACPPSLANFVASIYCLALNRNSMNAFDLARAKHSTWVARIAARSLGI